MLFSGLPQTRSRHFISLVDMGITPHTPTQNRTCAINAYGFSLYIFHTLSIKQTYLNTRF